MPPLLRCRICCLFLTLGVFCSVTAPGHCRQMPGASPPTPGDRTTPPLPSLHLSDMATADPERDLARAVARNDLRFIGVSGFSLMVPGVDGSAWSRIVRLKGVSSIQGTSDAIADAEQGRLQSLAFRYAGRYNALLLGRLRRGPDSDVDRVRREIDAELTRMERGPPAADARKAVHRGDTRLLAVDHWDGESRTPGLTPEQSVERPLCILAFSRDLATEEQTRQMRKLMVTYAAPYNRVVAKALPRRRYF